MDVIAWSKALGWFTGDFNQEKLKIGKKKSINKLSDAKTDEFITLKRFLKMSNIDITEESFLKALKIKSFYIKPVTESTDNEADEKERIKKFEAKWWKDFAKRCKECKKECKQSWMVTVIHCPSYERI